MQMTPVDPWNWQTQYGFTQCWKVQGADSLIFVSGQSNISADGEVLYSNDFEAQVELAFQNLRTVLDQAGATFHDVVKLGVYLTDMKNLMTFGAVQARHFQDHRPAQTMIQVPALALPGMDIEIEAIAVRP